MDKEEIDYSVFDIANWFLGKESMSPKKLQKLVYYAQAWSNALYNRPLMNTTFEAWRHGPVSRELWKKYHDYGWRDIEKIDSNDIEYDKDTTRLLDSVWDTYGDKDGDELEALTHRERPWLNARGNLAPSDSSNTPIKGKDMHDFYLSIYVGG